MGWHSDIPILAKGYPLNSPCTCTFFENVKNAPILLKFCVQKQLIKCIDLWKFEQYRTIFGRFNGSERTRARSKMLRFGSNFVCKNNLMKQFTTPNLSKIGAYLSVFWAYIIIACRQGQVRLRETGERTDIRTCSVPRSKQHES